MESLGIPMPKLVEGAPCVVKPADQGSSVGVSIVKDNKDLAKAITLAKKYSERVIIEEYIKGIEVSCGVIGNEEAIALPVIEIRPKKDFFDYETKYTGGMCEEVCPAEISAEVAKLVSDYAVAVFKGIGGRGFARVDMIIRNNLPYVLEINTIPGLTPNSLLPREAKAAGLSYGQMLDEIIRLALE
jgi:D-alanine-D-alanine ligase